MDQYLANLEARDKREQAQKRFIDQYSKLADRIAESESHPSAPTTTEDAPVSSPLQAPPDIDTLRTSLASAQKARAALEAEISSLSSLKQENQYQTKIIDGLNKELLAVQRKLRDRTEEVKEQKKLIENVQDEMISQNLQLNMCEEKVARIEKENKELIARWMEKMGEEADQMNKQSNW